MTEFTTRESFTCPIALIPAANQFMCWIGYGPGDLYTFHTPTVGDYGVASGVYKPEFVSRLGEPITEDNRPEWGAALDIEMARDGQAALGYEVDETEPTVGSLLNTATPSKITTTLKGVAQGAAESAPDWVSGTAMTIGQYCTFEGVTYMCIQAHTTQADWTPPVVPALFIVIAQGEEWTPGAQYAVDQECTYEGTRYVCIQAHTAQVGWEPPNVPALWREDTGFAQLHGPFTTARLVYWIYRDTRRPERAFIGINETDTVEADIWFNIAVLADKDLTPTQRTAIKRKARALGWVE